MGNWSIVWGLSEGECLGVEQGGYLSESQAYSALPSFKASDSSVIFSVVNSEEIA